MRSSEDYKQTSVVYQFLMYSYESTVGQSVQLCQCEAWILTGLSLCVISFLLFSKFSVSHACYNSCYFVQAGCRYSELPVLYCRMLRGLGTYKHYFKKSFSPRILQALVELKI